MVTVKRAYELIVDLEDKLRFDLRKAFSPEQNFQAYADFARQYLRAIGLEVNYAKVVEAVRRSKTVHAIKHRLDKRFSYNALIRDIAAVIRDSIAKDLVTGDGTGEIHSLRQVLKSYCPELRQCSDGFTDAEHIIAETRSADIAARYGCLVLRTEFLTPNNMDVADFAKLLHKAEHRDYGADTASNLLERC